MSFPRKFVFKNLNLAFGRMVDDASLLKISDLYTTTSKKTQCMHFRQNISLVEMPKNRTKSCDSNLKVIILQPSTKATYFQRISQNKRQKKLQFHHQFFDLVLVVETTQVETEWWGFGQTIGNCRRLPVTNCVLGWQRHTPRPRLQSLYMTTFI